MIEHVLANDDSTLARYGRDAGYVVLSDACRVLDRRMYNLFAENRTQEALAVLGYSKRIARVLASELNYSLYLDRLLFWENLSPEVRRNLVKLELEYYSFRSQLTRSPAEKLETYSSMLETFRKYDDVLFIALCEYELSYAYKTTGHQSQQIEYLKAACSDFARCGLHEMTCPTLGELGTYYESVGDIDSMVICYEEAGRVAKRARLPMEAAQIMTLYANHYSRRGRLALAHDLLMNAMETSRTYKGEYSELRSIVETMNFEADLGCWKIVERLLRRARVLQGKYDVDTRKYFALFSLQIDRVEGRLEMANGNVAKAQDLFERTMKAIEDLDMPYTREPEMARLYLFWSRGLLENRLPEDAVVVASRGLDLSMRAGLAEPSARIALLTARAALEVDDLAASRRAIARFDSLTDEAQTNLEREWIQRDALLGRLELTEGNRSGAERSLETGLDRLTRSVTSRDASIQSYLWIGECEDLRRLMHDLTSHDPNLGYGAELVWRNFYRLLGGDNPSDAGTDRFRNSSRMEEPEFLISKGHSIRSVLETQARAARHRIEDADAIHCVYVIAGDRIRRWTVTPDSIRSETLPASADETRRRVNETWRLMAPDHAGSHASRPHELSIQLGWLARVLLPPEVIDTASSGPKGPFFVTADGFLSRIPFEAFDISTGDTLDYIPLLSRRDVAYLRSTVRRNGSVDQSPGVILVNDKPSTEFETRYPFQRELKGAMIEAKTVASLKPDARVLKGTDATKSNLQSLWQNASFVYLATHTIRDPQVPYMMLIPLAGAAEPSAPDADYLDVTDIRAADLSRCHLVVLSGCSSGAPYVTAGAAGPSLGDAFVDSGAGAVVQTFWDVRDDDAMRVFTAFMQSLDSPGSSALGALCGARREVLEEFPGVENISRWAPFSITTRDI